MSFINITEMIKYDGTLGSTVIKIKGKCFCKEGFEFVNNAIEKELHTSIGTEGIVETNTQYPCKFEIEYKKHFGGRLTVTFEIEHKINKDGK